VAIVLACFARTETQVRNQVAVANPFKLAVLTVLLNGMGEFHIQQGQRSRNKPRQGKTPRSKPPGRIRRVSRLMALAIRFERLLRDGVVNNQAEFARLTRIIHLNSWAPRRV